MPSFPPSAFWDFSLETYARPGVAEACLRLQERHGVDVNLLLYCVWRASEGIELSPADIATARARVEAIHASVVRPLRAARTALKQMLITADPGLAPAMAALRATVKRSELDAEHVEQIMLAAIYPAAGKNLAPAARRAAAEAHVELYLRGLGACLTPADSTDLTLILDAAFPPKSQQSHELGAAQTRQD